MNASVLSIPQVVREGYRMLTNYHGELFTEETSQPVAPSFLNRRTPVSVIRIRVSSADRQYHLTVNALLSTAADASSISEPLAARLGIRKNGEIFVSGFRCTDVVAGLPHRHVDVECLDVVSNAQPSGIPRSTRVAFLIMAGAGKDMVLGADWLDEMQRRSDREMLFDSGPDMCRLRFLPAGERCETEEELQAFAKCTDIDDGEFVTVPWGYPDPGPAFDPSPSVCDMMHHVRPQNAGREELAVIRDAD